MSDLTRDEIRAILKWGKHVTVEWFRTLENDERVVNLSFREGGGWMTVQIPAKWVTSELPKLVES